MCYDKGGTYLKVLSAEHSSVSETSAMRAEDIGAGVARMTYLNGLNVDVVEWKVY